MSNRNRWEDHIPEEEPPFVNLLPADSAAPEDPMSEYGRGYDAGYVRGYEVGYRRGQENTLRGQRNEERIERGELP